MASTTVDVRDNRELSRLEAVLENDDVAGYSEYKVDDDGSFVFVHTLVEDRHSGEGIGTQLITGVMDFVRSNDARLHPECEFIRAYMQDHEETHDLLAEGASLEDPDDSSDDQPTDGS